MLRDLLPIVLGALLAFLIIYIGNKRRRRKEDGSHLFENKRKK